MVDRKPYLYATMLWLLMVVVFFWPAIFQGKVLAPLDIMDTLLRPWATTEAIDVHNAYTYDAISQYLPYDYSVFQSLRQDGYIGWNPYTHSGSSIVENTMICPGDWHHHLYRFLPFWAAWDAGIILQFALAGLGMLMLLRDQKIPAAYALIGIIAFGFYSQFTLWIYHRWVLGAMCWAPWIIWSLLRARRANRILDLPSIAFIALAFRGGHLQSCVFVVLLVLLLAIGEWWNHPERRRLRSVFQLMLPYALSGLLGAVLALDVLIETIPPFLDGGRDLPERSFFKALISLPTLITSIIPTLMGTPQGLDATKLFGVSLFSIKFAGAITLVCASLACFKKQAPIAAKVLLVVGILLPFTPADKWLYSRFTVIFALGAAWLAAWRISEFSREPRQAFWKYGWIVLGSVVLFWTLGSAVLAWKNAWLIEQIHAAISSKMNPGKASRLDWMFSRAEIFLTECRIWHPHNLSFLLFLTLGWWAASHIHSGNRKSQLFALVLACTTFGELFVFSRTWITFSNEPIGGSLYAQPEWVTRLQQEVGEGKVAVYDRSDFDYMQLNTPSAYHIRFADGYETVTPHRIDPYPSDDWHPGRFADAGISHLLVPPAMDPGNIAGWDKVLHLDAFILYKNPAYLGRSHATLASGTNITIQPVLETANRREYMLPAGVTAISLLESYNPGWKFSIDGINWKPVQQSTIQGIMVELPSPTHAESTHLRMQYIPAYQAYYRPIIGLALAGLIVISLFQLARRRNAISTFSVGT